MPKGLIEMDHSQPDPGGEYHKIKEKEVSGSERGKALASCFPRL